MSANRCIVVKLIPLAPNSKLPLKHHSWKKQMTDDPAVHEQWLKAGLNIGMPTGEPNGIMVVDYDDRDSAVRFYRENRERIKAITLTPRGGAHFYFRGDGRNAQGKPDIRGTGGYAVRRGTISGKAYREVPGYELRSVEQLTEFQDIWYPKRKEVAQQIRSDIRNARAYIGRIVAYGSSGHNSAFRAACRLRDAGYSEVDALAAMVEWAQTNSDPQLSVKEVLHKVRDVFRKGKSA